MHRLTTNITRSEHTRRQFLRALAVTGAGVAAAAGVGRALADVDVFEARLDAYSDKVVKFTTAWGQVVDDWYPAFVAAHADLAAYGGGRLIVTGGDATTERKYHISRCVVFDLPSVSVTLNAYSYVERVGDPDVWRGAPLGFHGYLNPDPAQRRQQNFAALHGPGKVGYPAAYLARYPHENGVGISYYKTVYVGDVHVPQAPGKGLTAQFGCNKVTFTGNTIGPTAQSADEQNWAGQAAITVQGGLNPPSYPLFTDAVITGNTVAQSVRGLYVDMCENVEVGDNQFAPLARAGLTVAACGNAVVRDNILAQVSRGAHGKYNGVDIVGVDNPDLLRNTLQSTTHNHCVYSALREGHGGVIYARGNHWTKGYGTVFSGSPVWDTD
jgi:hypothetical protein